MIGGVILSAGVNFFHVNVYWWGNPPTLGPIRVTSNSCKIHFGFALLLKASAVKVAARAASECRRALITETRGLTVFFLFTCLVTIRGLRGCKIACKGGLIFYPT